MAAFAVVSVSACNCGGGSGSDGGTDGGNSGQDAGPSTLSVDQFCQAAGLGYRNSTKAETKICGLAIQDSDWAHIEYNEPNFGMAVAFPEAWAGSDCSEDGGLKSQMAKYAAAASAGRMTYDGQKALECQAFGRDGGAATDIFGKLQGPCAQVWVAKAAVGAACEAHYECVAGNFCKRGATSCAGTCQPLKGENQACSDREPCKSDFVCDTSNADGGAGVCTALMGLGDACDSKNGPDCKPGFICFGEAGSETCVAPAKLGTACTRIAGVGSNCGEGTCVANIAVDAGVTQGMGVCKAVATANQPCGDGTNGKPRCDACTTCETVDGGATVCRPWGMEGADCSADSDCFDGRFFFCNLETSKCKGRPRSGQTCYRFDDGQGSVSPQGTCMYVDDFCSVIGAGDVGSPGTCKNNPKLGEACGSTSDLTDTCVGDTYCSVTDGGTGGTCTTKPATGQRCSSSKPGYTDCALSTDFCDTRTDAGAPGNSIGLCHATFALGTPCSSSGQCTGSASCPQSTDGGVSVCTDLLDNGQPCTAASACKSGYCPKPADAAAARVCAAQTANGQACKADGECESGTCDVMTKVCVAECTEVLSNASGCMNYDLTSMTSYVTFSLLLGLMVFPRRRR